MLEVLVVDDNDDNRDLLKLWLETQGFAVTTARDGLEAMERLTRGPRPAVVLLDLMMPGMNGWEVLAKLEADEALASIPVVVTSALDRDTVRAKHFLARPIDLDVLARLVRTLCEGPPADREDR